MLPMKLNYINAQCLLIAFMLISCKEKKSEAQGDPDSVAISSPVSETKTSARPVHWGYEDQVGPAMWASLSPVYAACGEGKSQSPINLVTSAPAGNPDWSVDLNTTSSKIAHHEHVHDILENGLTIQVTVEVGSTMTWND